MASSSTSSPAALQSTIDVFISFRGQDTRDKFTSHLYSTFFEKGVAVFIAKDGLNRGDEIIPRLLEAIEQSKVSVIIFSKGYASSRWCLDELAKILECRKLTDQIVIPVFYNVDPTVIRNQTRSFKVAFVECERHFRKMIARVQKWRTALTEAANLTR